MSELEPYTPRELVTKAASRGVLSVRSAQALQRVEIDRQVQDALEDSFTANGPGTILLVTMMPDDSASMQEFQAVTATTKQSSVMEGHNELLYGMSASKERDHILMQTRYLNGHLLNPFSPLPECASLTFENYPCKYGTPLFEQTLVTLGTVMAKSEELIGAGLTVRTATLIMSDGLSTEGKGSELAREVASVVSDMKKVGDHIVAGMSFTSDASGKYSDPFLAMNIDSGHIYSATSREGILEAFRVFKRKAIGEITSGRVFEM